MRRLLALMFLPIMSAGLAAMPPAPADGRPSARVASVNLCADQLAVQLVPRDRIASVTMLAADTSLSYVASQVAGLAVNSGAAEEIVASGATLVLAGQYGGVATKSMLAARGLTVLELGPAEDFEAIRRQVRQVAAAVDEAERGEQLLTAMDRILATARPTLGETRPSALVWQSSGYTAGEGTLLDAVLKAAGFANFAAAAGLRGYGYVSLETVVAGRPDLLIAVTHMPDYPSLSDALLHHPALARLPRIEVPATFWACPGPFTAEAVALLAAHRRAASGVSEVAGHE